MIKVRAPANLMLMGEHAVLHGELALVVATQNYISLELSPRSDRRVFIDSELAHYEGSLDKLEPEPRLSFVMAAIERYRQYLSKGFNLSIRSEFSAQVGLGSSAAVTAAVVAALACYSDQKLTNEQLFEQALAVVHQVQSGRGSGADLAASIYGGLVAYRMSPREIQHFDITPEIDLYYVGYKVKTPEVIRQVDARASTQPDLYRHLYRLMGETTEAAVKAVAEQNMPALGQLMNLYAGLMDALGVCDINLAQLQYHLRGCESVLGAKISGSGLGDSVICLGKADPEQLDYRHIPVEVSPQGVELTEGLNEQV